VKLIQAPSCYESKSETAMHLRSCLNRYFQVSSQHRWNGFADPCEAEDLVQDVFLLSGPGRNLFDPRRGDAHRGLCKCFTTAHSTIEPFSRGVSGVMLGLPPPGFLSTTADILIHGALEFPSGIDNLGELFYWQSFLKPAFESLTESQRRTLTLYYFEDTHSRRLQQKQLSSSVP